MPAIDVDDLAKLSTQPWAQNILTSMTITYRREAGLTDTGPRPVWSPHSTWWRDLGDRLAAANDAVDANPADDGLVTEIQAAGMLQRGYETAPSQPAVDLPSTTTAEPQGEDA